MKAPTAKSSRATEAAIQKACVDYLRILEGQGRATGFAVPNGEYRDKITAARLKAQGVRAGAPDLIVVVPGRVLFVEIKTQVGRLSPDQRAYHKTLSSLGIETAVIRSVSDFIELVKGEL